MLDNVMIDPGWECVRPISPRGRARLVNAMKALQVAHENIEKVLDREGVPDESDLSQAVTVVDIDVRILTSLLGAWIRKTENEATVLCNMGGSADAT